MIIIKMIFLQQFLSAKRAEVKAKHPELSMIETTKKLAEMWGALDDAGSGPCF
jgi:hypothetical protein